MINKRYPVTGMHCAACAINVEKVIKKQAGVQEVAVNLADNSAVIAFDEKVISPEALKESVVEIGYDLIVDEQAASPEAIERVPIIAICWII